MQINSHLLKSSLSGRIPPYSTVRFLGSTSVLDVVPKLKEIGIDPRITKSGKSVRFPLGDYRLTLATRTGGRYTGAIHSKNKTSEQALGDFPGSIEISASGTEESSRCARIPMSSLDKIMDILQQ